jgi:uncharacterized protein YndB with AHSA1/START domain
MSTEKNDPPPRLRSVQAEIEVPGTPEQVWQVISTGPGITAWFTPAEVDSRLGGAITYHWGGGVESSGVVTVWEPPHRVVYEDRGWPEGAPPLATEYRVEARSGGTCIVRLVTSLFTNRDDWDDQLKGMEKGWPTFLRIMKVYLTHYAGQPCTNVRAFAMTSGAEDAAWDRFVRAVGLAGAAPGQRRAVAGTGVPTLAGVVERVGANDLLLHMDQPVPGCALLGAYDCGGSAQLSTNLFLYGGRGAEVAAKEMPAWQAWMDAFAAG